MNPSRFVFISVISLLLLSLSVDVAMAARQGFLMGGNLRQWVDLSYSFDAHSYRYSSDTQHYFTEKYNISLDYALASPRLLNGNMTLALEADQYNAAGSNVSRGNDSKYGLQYDIKGSVLDKSPIPLNFLVQSQIQEVQRPFGGNYRLAYDTYAASWSVRNKFVPLTLNAIRSVSTTEGLEEDRKTTHNEVGIHAQHAIPFSLTTMDIIATDDRFSFVSVSGSDFSRSYEFNFNNTLHWVNSGLSRDLYSSLKIRDDAGINTGNTLFLNESYNMDLGKALRTGMTYSLSKLNSFRGDQQTQSGTIWLQHILYKSLTTQLLGSLRDLDFGNGTEAESTGKVSLAYKKLLPAGGVLALNTYRQYTVTDRKLGSSNRQVLDEHYTVQTANPVIQLNSPNIIPGTISVRNANPDPAFQFPPYAEGVGADYQVVQAGALTQIIVSGKIVTDSQLPNGNELLISYQFRTDADIRFATDSVGAGGDLSLWNGDLRFFARYDEFAQEALSDDASGLGLGYQTTIITGAETRWKKYLMTLQYSRIDGALQKSQYLDGTVSYTDTWGRGTVSLYAKNSYRWYEPINGVSRESDDILSAGGTYRRPIILAGTFSLTSNYERYMSTVSTDRLSITAQLNWYFRKFIMSLQAREGFTRGQGATTHAEHLRLHLIRYF